MGSQMLVAVLVIALLSLVACGTPEAEVVGTPTPDQAATATVAALATENARLATQVATLTVPTPTPMPDLGKLAYVQGGDIWVKSLPDGKPQRLTTDGRNAVPRWAPSGQWLAFRKGDYQVWVMRAGGRDGRPLNGGAAVNAFAWSPLADRLTYVAGDDVLQTVDADGNDLMTLVPQAPGAAGPGRKVNRIAWSPDGAWIAYEWLEQQPGQPPAYEGLWKISAEGKEPVELYVGGTGQIGEPRLVGWTSDSRFILVQEGMHSASLLADGSPIYGLPADGGAPVQLADTVLAYPDFVAPAPPGTSWGTHGGVAIVVGAGRESWLNKRIEVGQEPRTPEGMAAISPAWSPNGERIAYAAMPERSDLAGGEPVRQALMQRHIWVMSAMGPIALQQLTNDPAYRDERPLWSADGSHILFARLDQEDRASLWLTPAEGGEPQQVVEELTPAPGWFGYYGHIEWHSLFDWWRGPAARRAQLEPTAVASVPTRTFPTPTPPPTATPAPTTQSMQQPVPPLAVYGETPPAGTPETAPPSDIRSYHAVVETFSHAPIGDARWWIERWYQAPDQFRQKVDKLEGPPSAASDRTFVRNGDTVWLYIPAENRVIINQADPTFGQPERVPPGAVYEAFEVHLLGDETIAGRVARGLRLEPKDPETANEIHIWYDRETRILLRQEEYAPDGTLLHAEWVLEVQFNVDLPAKLFTFEPPAGAQVEDWR